MCDIVDWITITTELDLIIRNNENKCDINDVMSCVNKSRD